MARMHARKRGKSASRKKERKIEWIKTPKKEIVKKIVGLAKQGTSSAKIGLILRDKYGIADVKAILGKGITQIRKENKVEVKYPEDLMDLIKRATNLRKHLKNNRRDRSNTKELVDIESKIKRLVKYYRGKKLPEDWRYDPEEAALLVK